MIQRNIYMCHLRTHETKIIYYPHFLRTPPIRLYWLRFVFVNQISDFEFAKFPRILKAFFLIRLLELHYPLIPQRFSPGLPNTWPCGTRPKCRNLTQPSLSTLFLISDISFHYGRRTLHDRRITQAFFISCDVLDLRVKNKLRLERNSLWRLPRIPSFSKH